MEADESVDYRGLVCPMPILETSKKMKEMESGKVLEILVDDEGAKEDFPSWCKRTGNEFLGEEDEDDTLKFYIKKR